MSLSPDIFLSYNRDDQAKARRFAQAFEAHGFSVWWDVTLRSGEAYDEVTEKALRDAKAVVVLWSKKSVVSRWVRAESTVADRNKTLVPVMIEPCERPIMFELTQTADLTLWQGAANDDAWLGFLADVRGFVERDRAPSQVTPPSPALAPVASATPIGERGAAPSLAVLPFTNRSGVAEDEVFAIGMVEDVIDALSQGVYVRVISSAATARFRTGAISDLDAMARQLGVRYVLEGNVRRVGTTLRVTSQLIEADSGAILWTQKFDRPLSELAALQEDLVREVAASLDTQIHKIEMERVLRKPGNLTAWEAVTRAIAALRALNIGNMAVSMDEARKAVAIAPDYALAHAVFAMASAVYYTAFCPDDAAEVGRIRSHVDRALNLDPNNPLVLAHISEALSYIGFPADGLRHAESALRLNPGVARAHFAAGIACEYLQRTEDAVAHYESEIRASPGALRNHLTYARQGSSYVGAGRWSEALAACDKSLALNLNSPWALICKSIACQKLGHAAEARELLVRTRQAETAGTLSVWELNVSRILAGSPIRADLVDTLRALWAETDSAT